MKKEKISEQLAAWFDDPAEKSLEKEIRETLLDIKDMKTAVGNWGPSTLPTNPAPDPTQMIEDFWFTKPTTDDFSVCLTIDGERIEVLYILDSWHYKRDSIKVALKDFTTNQYLAVIRAIKFLQENGVNING